jgi:hypothetical protein
MVLGIVVAIVSLSVSLSGQGAAPRPPASPRPWPPALTPDGQPDVQGSWRPVIGGTHSLDPAKSGAADFEERIGGVAKPNPSRIVDPPDGHIPYQPWAAALQKKLEAVYENPTSLSTLIRRHGAWWDPCLACTISHVSDYSTSR